MAIGIVLGNLGTPASATPQDVKKYLRQFLMDPYVIDKPWWFRALLVYGLIVPFRAKKSAHAYATIWTDEGSPLLTLSRAVASALQLRLGAGYKVEVGMRYGEPSVRSALEKLQDCEKIILLPQYPQYAKSSSKTWSEEARKSALALNLRSPVIEVPPFYADDLYLTVLADQFRSFLSEHDVDHVLLSFHGLPESHMTEEDPSGRHCLKSNDCCEAMGPNNQNCYRAQCYFVARELARRLGWTSADYTVSFQSRLGREPWIQPFTDQVLKELPQKGHKRVAVAMPAFTVDCLETLEEIHLRGREDFMAAGGEAWRPLPCLNATPDWIAALAKMVHKSLAQNTNSCG